MGQSEDDAAGKAKCKIFAPPPSLIMKAAVSGAGQPNKLASIERAERALGQMSAEFEDWMAQNLRALSSARDEVSRSGPTDTALDALLVAALDIKGSSTMLGYPFAGATCASLCNLIERCPDRSRIPQVLIDYHIDAVNAELRENADRAKEKTASALVDRLRSVTQDFLDNELARASGAGSTSAAGPSNGGASSH